MWDHKTSPHKLNKIEILSSCDCKDVNLEINHKKTERKKHFEGKEHAMKPSMD